MKEKITQEFIMDWWLTKYHGITCKWVVEKHPKLCKSINWYKKYAVTQEQHDEWYEWAIKTLMKHYGFGREKVERMFAIDCLNCAPEVKKPKK